jgi:predicted phosphodiesterase
MRIAVTADLHYGHNRLGDEATRLLRQKLDTERVDLVLLGGDLGTDEHFDTCLRLFADLPCPCAVVPGNHDLWVGENDARGDSLEVYQQHLPNLCSAQRMHYLDRGPLLFPDADFAVVGNINWYDYSWSIERLRAEVPDWEWHLRNKAFSRGRHNDGRFIRWPTDDIGFTRDVVATFHRHVKSALAKVKNAIVVTHHPALHGLSFPRDMPARELDPLLWEAFSGNTAMEAVLTEHADCIPFIFSGHTHRERECRLGKTIGLNVGGDYHFKRMLLLDWPLGTVEAHVFGDPNRRR